eukprot:TRINITY_DN6783_c1_g1_i2.p1 TRINITY_DN6783_c1_g1~~TRINITY_DN6783_c1_g1_i2.p1  ORF type:complete len:446 (+),score=67.27 TRINITY_DN6783_c1_g1_i2:57-1394(+)
MEGESLEEYRKRIGIPPEISDKEVYEDFKKEKERQHELEMAKINATKKEQSSRGIDEIALKLDQISLRVYDELKDRMLKWGGGKLEDGKLKDELSLPTTVSEIPFPSVFLPKERFSLQEGLFKFSGRSNFKTLLELVKRKFDTYRNPTYKDERKIGIFIFGNFGGGKSHLLMALAAYLMIESYDDKLSFKVAVLPYCSRLNENPLGILKQALIFCFAGDEKMTNKIKDCNSLNDLTSLLKVECYERKLSIIWIVDQFNELEKGEHTGKVNSFLEDFFTVYGASSNNESRKKRDLKQQGLEYFDIYGGFDDSEFESWFQGFKKGFIDVSPADQQETIGDNIDKEKIQIGFLTGRVPLFLTYLEKSTSGKPFADWRTNFLNYLPVRSHIEALAKITGIQEHPEMYIPFLNPSVANSLPSAIDHRYFYTLNGYGYCVAGFIAEGLQNK